jgi:hypothetical protein
VDCNLRSIVGRFEFVLRTRAVLYLVFSIFSFNTFLSVVFSIFLYFQYSFPFSTFLSIVFSIFLCFQYSCSLCCSVLIIYVH